jgi:hypothetical protein
MKKLKAASITVSMTNSGEAYENLGSDADIVTGPLPKEGMAY